MLRRQEYKGSIVMLSDDDAAPVDRPNLSKDYLPATRRRTGSRCAATTSIRTTASIFAESHVAGIDPRSREVDLGDGGKVAYDRLLLATGAEPVRLAAAGRRPRARPHLAHAWPTAAPSSAAKTPSAPS
jgi:NADPH-dependent 2,4-dienoyl-CoA reductase/sulfur reductase-like enzyme